MQAPAADAAHPSLAALRGVFQRAGFAEDRVADLLGSTDFITQHSHEFGRALHRTKTPTPLNVLTRLFLLAVPIQTETVAEALAPVTPAELKAIALVREEGDRLIPLVTVLPHGDLWVAFDQPEKIESGASPDLVNAITHATLSLANAAIRRPVRSTLDVGTGSGVLALLAASWSDQVWAVDLNPRAVEFARFNAALNAKANVHCAVGDLFAPVSGRQFDLILCNPPFAVTPSKRYVYRDSGMEGDAFSRRIVREVPAYLSEGGFLQMLFEWVHPKGEDWKARLSEWFDGSGCDAWVMKTETMDPLRYADKWIATTERLGAETAAALYDEWIAWYQSKHYEAISSGYAIMRRRSAAHNWISIEDAAPVRSGLCGDQILEGFEARDFLRGLRSDADLMNARLRVTKDLEMIQRCEWEPGRWNIVAAQVRITRGLQQVANIDQHLSAIIMRCDGKRMLAEVLAEVASLLKVDVQRIAPACMPIMKALVERGFLVPVEHQ